jgi:tetratricopeptide (TPR) repeat protein
MDDSFLKKRALSLWKEAQEVQLREDLDRAIDLYTKSIDIYPTAEAHTFRGWAYSFQNRLEDAIEECKKGIELDPEFGNPYNDIGSYLFRLGRLDDAIEWLEKAKLAKRYEPRHFPYMNLGRVYAAKGMLLLAIREFRAALQIRPGEPSCLAAIEELRGALN